MEHFIEHSHLFIHIWNDFEYYILSQKTLLLVTKAAEKRLGDIDQECLPILFGHFNI